MSVYGGVGVTGKDDRSPLNLFFHDLVWKCGLP